MAILRTAIAPAVPPHFYLPTLQRPRAMLSIVIRSAFTLILAPPTFHLCKYLLLNPQSPLFPKSRRRIKKTNCLLPGIPDDGKPSVSFSGCGAQYGFYIGIVKHLQDTFNTDDIRIAATSGGVFPAVPMAIGKCPIEWMERDWGKCVSYWKSRGLLGFFLDDGKFFRQLWSEYLPPDAHETCSGRLYIVVSRMSFSWELFGPVLGVGTIKVSQEVVSEYRSNAALIDAIVGTCHILGLYWPVFFPRVHGRQAFDGCYVNTMPLLHASKTVVCKLFGRGVVDNGNATPVWHLLKIPTQKELESLIRRGGELTRDADDWCEEKGGWVKKKEKETRRRNSSKGAHRISSSFKIL